MGRRDRDRTERADRSGRPDDEWDDDLGYGADLGYGDRDYVDDPAYGDDDAVDDAFDFDDDWTEEDERRYQARRQLERLRARRRRRQAASFGIVVLLVIGAGMGATGLYLGWWSWPGGKSSTAATAQPCPQPTPTAAAPAEVSVTVLNSTDRTGLAASVAQQLKARGFVVAGVGNDPSPTPVAEAAQVRHGTDGVMAARAVAAQIKGAVLVDDGRSGASVDVSLGAAFTDMATPEEAAALTAPAPVASPPGCVPASTG